LRWPLTFFKEGAMEIVVAIVIGLVVIGVIASLLGIAVIIGASDELYREYDDRDQAEYIQRWMEKKKQKEAQRRARRRKR
jgi:hypothetical protein